MFIIERKELRKENTRKKIKTHLESEIFFFMKTKEIGQRVKFDRKNLIGLWRGRERLEKKEESRDI